VGTKRAAGYPKNLFCSGETVSRYTFYILKKPLTGFRRFSILPALSLDGILALEIQEGSFTSITFAQFIDGLLTRMNPFPGPNSVIVMDNARIHQSPLIPEIIADQSVLFQFNFGN
jgi:hypothetical protein